ncbi:hypothetical protein P5V15_014540 [Pogonomyrmex californicus]
MLIDFLFLLISCQLSSTKIVSLLLRFPRARLAATFPSPSLRTSEARWLFARLATSSGGFAVPLIKSLESDSHVSPGSQKRREIGQVAEGKGTTLAAKEKEERGRTGVYRPRVQGHKCEGYRTSLPPGRANLSDTVRRHSLFHARKEEGEEEEEQRERRDAEKKEKKKKVRNRESIFQRVELVSDENIVFSEKHRASTLYLRRQRKKT